jgi:hypothetical protein
MAKQKLLLNPVHKAGFFIPADFESVSDAPRGRADQAGQAVCFASQPLNHHPQPAEYTPKDSPKSIVPWCMGHKKGPHAMQASDFNEGKG